MARTRTVKPTLCDPMLVIKDWALYFENNRTRDLKKMAWVPIPNKHDGDGYTQLIDHENGVSHFGVWVLLLEVASKCGSGPEDRGRLVRSNGQPHTAITLARITRVPASIIADSITRLLDIEWIEYENGYESAEPVGAEQDAGKSHLPATFSHPPALNGTERNGKNGKNGTELYTILQQQNVDKLDKYDINIFDFVVGTLQAQKDTQAQIVIRDAIQKLGEDRVRALMSDMANNAAIKKPVAYFIRVSKEMIRKPF